MKNILFLSLFFSLKIFSQEKEKTEVCPLEFGTSFTINAESTEDWKFSCDCPFAGFHITVYNQWGNEVFKADTIPPTKILKCDFKKLAAGVYVYTLKCMVENKGEFTCRTV